MNLSQDTIESLQNKVLNWYNNNKRDFPWRKTTNPYYIHISEIMLQQTQAQRVISYYNTFISKYPTVKSLSEATNTDLLYQWQGLGFNSRAIRLKEAATQIHQNYNDQYPQNRKTLQKFPGIGPYTSSAILAFAFNMDVPVVDTNIRRFLIYELNLSYSTSQKELETIARKLTPKGKAREWNNALMDYSNSVTTVLATGISSQGKQGKFKGSTREVRSHIIKQLLENKTLTKQILEKRFPKHNIDNILHSLEKDSMIIQNNCRIYLKE